MQSPGRHWLGFRTTMALALLNFLGNSIAAAARVQCFILYLMLSAGRWSKLPAPCNRVEGEGFSICCISLTVYGSKSLRGCTQQRCNGEGKETVVCSIFETLARSAIAKSESQSPQEHCSFDQLRQGERRQRGCRFVRTVGYGCMTLPLLLGIARTNCGSVGSDFVVSVWYNPLQQLVDGHNPGRLASTQQHGTVVFHSHQ